MTSPSDSSVPAELNAILRVAQSSGVAHNGGAGGQWLLCATEAQLKAFATALAGRAALPVAALSDADRELLEKALDALTRSNEWLATYPGGGTMSPTGPYEQARRPIAALRTRLLRHSEGKE